MWRPASAAALALLACLAPCRAAPPIESYGRLPGIELIRISPSGQRYAFVAVVGESRKLYVLDYDGKVLSAIRVGTAKVRELAWAGDDHVLVTTTTTFDDPWIFVHAYELATVINLGLDNKQAAAVFDKYRGVAAMVLGYFGSAQADGHVYGYFGGTTYARSISGNYYLDHSYPDLYRVDLATGKVSLQAHGSGDYHEWVLSREGSVVAHSEYDQRAAEWWLYAGADAGKVLLKKKAPMERIDLIGQGRAAGTVLVADHEGDDDVTEEVSVADGTVAPLFGDVSIEKYLLDPDSGLLIGARTGEEPGATFFDPHLQARYLGARNAFPGLHMRLESYSRNLDRMIVFTDGGDDSGTYWMVDIASGKANEIGHPYPDIGSAEVGPVRTFRYTAADGTPIEGVLTLPPGRKPEKLPLVMLPHGGPIGVRDLPGFDWWAQAYAAQGYAVLQPNYRGSFGYGRRFREAGFGEWGGKMLSDIADGMGALAAQGLIDPKRACIVGASYGGYAALAGVTLQHGLYRCAVSVAGVSDMPELVRWDTKGRGEHTAIFRYFEAATGDQDDGRFKAISPYRYAEHADAPILLIHGKDDTVVPFEQSETMASALKHAGKAFEFVEMKGEDHWLSREQTRITMLKAAVDFVKRHNPPDLGPDPAPAPAAAVPAASQ